MAWPHAAPAVPAPKTLTVCDDVQEPATLDAHKQFSEKNHTLVQQIFEGLVRFDPEGRVVPALAVSWKRLDPLRVRFKLRPGVVFHNGDPFDAEAVRFSLARYLDPATGFPAYGYLAIIDRAEAVDPLTVDVITKAPDGLLLNRLAGFVLIVAPGPVRADPKAHHERPVGTGAFRFESWKRGHSVSLVRNERYWDKQQPRLDRLVFRFIPSDRQWEALKSGEVDVLTELPGTLTTEAVRTGGISVVKKPSFYTVTSSFNVSTGPLSDVRVRQAINYAVNRQDVIRFDLFGNGRPVATVTMPGEEGHNQALKPFPYDPERARRLLKEAGFAKGFTLKVATKVQGERAARIVAKQLAEVGVTLDLHLFSDAELMPVLARESWDMFFAGCPDPMSHSFFIQSIFAYSRSPYKVAAHAGYDGLLERMVGTIDDSERRRLGEEVDALLHKESLMLFLYQRIKTYGVRRGVVFTPWITGMPYFFSADKR